MWHAAYYNDSTAVIIILRHLRHTGLILEPDTVYMQSPLELSKLHRNKDCFDVFKHHVNQKDLDAHWHHNGVKDDMFV